MNDYSGLKSRTVRSVSRSGSWTAKDNGQSHYGRSLTGNNAQSGESWTGNKKDQYSWEDEHKSKNSWEDNKNDQHSWESRKKAQRSWGAGTDGQESGEKRQHSWEAAKKSQHSWKSGNNDNEHSWEATNKTNQSERWTSRDAQIDSWTGNNNNAQLESWTSPANDIQSASRTVENSPPEIGIAISPSQYSVQAPIFSEDQHAIRTGNNGQYIAYNPVADTPNQYAPRTGNGQYALGAITNTKYDPRTGNDGQHVSGVLNTTQYGSGVGNNDQSGLSGSTIANYDQSRGTGSGRLVLAFNSERGRRGFSTPSEPGDSFPVTPATANPFEDGEARSLDINSQVSIVQYHDKEVQCNFDDEKPRKKVQAPSDGSLPTGSRLAILLVCTCMAIFLQALVSPRISSDEKAKTNSSAGHHDHIHRHSQNYSRVSLHRASWLVWIRVLPHQLLVPIAVG